MKKERRMFGSENPNSFMILGLINELTNNGAITAQQRIDILSLGDLIEEFSILKDAKKIKEQLNDLKE